MKRAMIGHENTAQCRAGIKDDKICRRLLINQATFCAEKNLQNPTSFLDYVQNTHPKSFHIGKTMGLNLHRLWEEGGGGGRQCFLADKVTVHAHK